MIETKEAKMQVHGLVSIVIPCFNAAPYIRQCLNSVKNQTYQSFEIILLDDGSTDNTIALAKMFETCTNLTILGPYSNLGPFSLRNIGISKARGEYLAFLDADDEWAPRKLEIQVNELNSNQEIGLSHTEVQVIDKEGNDKIGFLFDRTVYKDECFYKMLRYNGMANSSVVVRRSVFENMGVFNESFRFRGDWEMWVRIASKYKVAFHEEILTKYREHDSNVSKDLEKVRRYAFLIVREFERLYAIRGKAERAILRATLIDTYKAYGLMALVDRNYEMARKDLFNAFKMRPWDSVVTLAILKTFLYPAFGIR